MSIPMTVTEQGELYMVAYRSAFNSDAGGHLFTDGIAGPVSAGEAKRLHCVMGCTLFKVEDGRRVRWVIKGEIIEPMYETDSEVESREWLEELARKEAVRVAAKQKASAAAVVARDQEEEELRQLEPARAIVAKHDAKRLKSEAAATKKREAKLVQREKAMDAWEKKLQAAEGIQPKPSK